MLVEHIYEGDAKPFSPMPRGIIRSSMSEACTRRAAYEYLRYPPEQSAKNPDLQQAVMEDGNLHEQDLVRRLINKGYFIYNYLGSQTWVITQKNHIKWRGHPDVFVEQEGMTFGVEIKGYRDEVFKKYTDGALEVEPGIYHIQDPKKLAEGAFPIMGQIQLYLQSEKAQEMGIEFWVLLMKNKNTAELAECVVPYDPEYIEGLYNKWKNFWAYVESGRLPKRNFEKESVNCKSCPFRQRCWGPLSEVDGEVVLDDPEAQKMAEFWKEYKDLENYSESRKQAARLYFEEAAVKHNASTLKIDNLEIKVSNRERNGLNTENVEKILTRLRKEGVISSEELGSCYETTEYTTVTPREKKTK